ncbi:MAG: hypothetical protein KGR98_07410 [Verrucomicrobia bacterium]|nr:hypothetical protein [Verrucomicrobiota bacterium]MDE3098565.1 hypothetical protein [Verrucomicrobiota bacterium]
MKEYVATMLGLLCVALVIALVVIKNGDNALQQVDAGTIADYSNRLDSAQTELAIREGGILTLSNSLDQSQSAWLALSNQLTAARSSVAIEAEQITNLNHQVAQLAGVQAENQALTCRVADLANQVAGLARRIALGDADLAEANQNYSLLENRLRRDVAERLTAERKFHNVAALQAQIEKLQQWSPSRQVSAQDIYAGLDVEVTSNSFYVISPN